MVQDWCRTGSRQTGAQADAVSAGLHDYVGQMSLAEVCNDELRKSALVQDGLVELEAELESRSGFGGAAMRTGYKTVTKLRPGFIESNIERLLPRFAPVLDPHLELARTSGDVEGHLVAHADEIAEGLLGATDQRVAESNNKIATKVYAQFRPKAKENTVEAMPRLAKLLAKHA